MKKPSFVPLYNVDKIFRLLPDASPPAEQIESRLHDYRIWGKGLDMTLRCFRCGKTSRSIFPDKDCPCGYQQIYVTRPLRQAAEALSSAGFELRGAADIIATADLSDDVMLLVHVDFAREYDRDVFFGCAETALPESWDCLTIQDNMTGAYFTRLFSNGELPVLTIDAEAKTEVKRLAAELTQWAKDFRESMAWAVMVFMGKI